MKTEYLLLTNIEDRGNIVKSIGDEKNSTYIYQFDNRQWKKLSEDDEMIFWLDYDAPFGQYNKQYKEITEEEAMKIIRKYENA